MSDSIDNGAAGLTLFPLRMEDAISDDDKPTIATVSPNGIMQLQSCCSQGDSTPEYSPTGSDVVGQSVRKRR